MFESIELDPEKKEKEPKPKIINIYAIIKKSKDKTIVQFAWRGSAFVERSEIDNDTKKEKITKFNMEAEMVSETIEKLATHLFITKTNPEIVEIDFSSYQLNFDISEEDIKEIKKNKEEENKEETKITIRNLSDEEIEIFKDKMEREEKFRKFLKEKNKS